MTLKENIQKVQARLQIAAEKAHRNPEEITLLAVSKLKPHSMIRDAWDLGLAHFGENYVKEWREKYEKLEDLRSQGLKWHLTGPLQRNKCKYVAGKMDLIHTISSAHLLDELSKRLSKGQRQAVLLQCNLAKESTKSGFQEISEIEELLAQRHHWPQIDIQGLMVIPPFSSDPEASRPHFRQLAELREQLRRSTGLPLPHLSMGMSADLEVAIEEGATIIRVGTAIFGPRNK